MIKDKEGKYFCGICGKRVDIGSIEIKSPSDLDLCKCGDIIPSEMSVKYKSKESDALCDCHRGIVYCAYKYIRKKKP